MRNYDLDVRHAKDHMTKMLIRLTKDKNTDPMEIGQAVDHLNKMWDDLTDALVRQREERDRVIHNLLNQLAERKER